MTWLARVEQSPDSGLWVRFRSAHHVSHTSHWTSVWWITDAHEASLATQAHSASPSVMSNNMSSARTSDITKTKVKGAKRFTLQIPQKHVMAEIYYSTGSRSEENDSSDPVCQTISLACGVGQKSTHTVEGKSWGMDRNAIWRGLSSESSCTQKADLALLPDPFSIPSLLQMWIPRALPKKAPACFQGSPTYTPS